MPSTRPKGDATQEPADAPTGSAPRARRRSRPPKDVPAVTAPETHSRWSWPGAGRIVRLGLAAVVVAAVVVALAIGWPILYDRYIAPIQTNTSDLDAVRERLTTVEQRIEGLANDQAALAGRVGTLDEQLAEHDRRLAALDAVGERLVASGDEGREETAREVAILRAMELMSRARLFMFQSNFGLAEQDLEAARELLAGVSDGTTSTSRAAIDVALGRLDRVLVALPEFPVVASDDLDIAWQALLGRSPTSTSEPEPTAQPTPAEPEPTATPAP